MTEGYTRSKKELWAGDTERRRAAYLIVREHSSSPGLPAKLHTLLWRRLDEPTNFLWPGILRENLAPYP
ncbi:MAG: hypothetical protein LBF72_00870 [Holosporales bacterium]|nr:hypothetical protein [Holosporales bacterium]